MPTSAQFFLFYFWLKPPPGSACAGCMQTVPCQLWGINQAAPLLFETGQAAAHVTCTSKQRGSSNPAVSYRSAHKLLFLLGSWPLATRFCLPGWVAAQFEVTLFETHSVRVRRVYCVSAGKMKTPNMFSFCLFFIFLWRSWNFRSEVSSTEDPRS